MFFGVVFPGHRASLASNLQPWVWLCWRDGRQTCRHLVAGVAHICLVDQCRTLGAELKPQGCARRLQSKGPPAPWHSGVPAAGGQIAAAPAAGAMFMHAGTAGGPGARPFLIGTVLLLLWLSIQVKLDEHSHCRI